MASGSDSDGLYERATRALSGSGLSAAGAVGGASTIPGVALASSSDGPGFLERVQGTVGAFGAQLSSGAASLAAGVRETNQTFTTVAQWGAIGLIAAAVIVVLLVIAYFASPVIGALNSVRR